MKYANIILSLLSLVLAFSACTEESNLISSPDQLVVEGYLSPGIPIDVKVTKEIRFGSDSINRAVTGLSIKVSDGQNTFLLKDNNDGHYYSKSTEIVKGAKTYSLSFSYQGSDVTSTTTVPSKPQNFTASVKEIKIQAFNPGNFSGGLPSFPDPVELKWKNDALEYHLVVAANYESSPQLINSSSDAPKLPSFRTEPSTGKTHSIRSMEFKYYGRHYLILYKINPEYAALYESTGNSSQNLRTPNSNIKNAQGIFTAVNSDTLLLNVKKP